MPDLADINERVALEIMGWRREYPYWTERDYIGPNFLHDANAVFGPLVAAMNAKKRYLLLVQFDVRWNAEFSGDGGSVWDTDPLRAIVLAALACISDLKE